MKKATGVLSAVVIAFGIWVIILSQSLGRSLIPYDIGPAVYPRLLCYVLIGLAVMLVIADCFIKKEDSPLQFLRWKNLFHFAIVLVFILMFNWAGFPLSAFAIIAVMMVIMGCDKPWFIITFSASASAAFYLVFRLLLNVHLPLGLLDTIF